MNNQDPTVEQSLELIKNSLQQLNAKWSDHLLLAKALMVIDNRIKELEKQIAPTAEK